LLHTEHKAQKDTGFWILDFFWKGQSVLFPLKTGFPLRYNPTSVPLNRDGGWASIEHPATSIVEPLAFEAELLKP
jgi:hypothetical protein